MNHFFKKLSNIKGFTKKNIYNNTKSSGIMSGVVLADNIQSSAELKVLEKAANDLKAKLAALKLIIHETEAEDEQAEKERKAAEFHASQKTDILGYSQSDWDSLKINISKGKIAVNEVVMAVDVLKNAWSAYSNYLTAAENKRLKQVEASNTKQKTSLQDQLDKGLISQTTYNTKVKALDDDLQKQKDKAAYDQAIREARLAEISVIQNAAVATIALWKSPGFPLAIPLTALVAGMAVASIATIEANLPDAPALAEGGFTDGISVAGEAGTEWVASNKLLKDKKTGPVIKWLENYQRGGKSIPMPIQANFSGIQNAIDNRNSASLPSGNTQSIQNDPEVKGLLVKLIVSQNEGRDEMKLLNKYLSNPENRKARLVRDELTKFDNEMSTLQSLAKIA